MTKPWEPGKPRRWGIDSWIVPVRAVTQTMPRLWLVQDWHDAVTTYGGTRYELEDETLAEVDAAQVELERAEWAAREILAAQEVERRGSDYATLTTLMQRMGLTVTAAEQPRA